MSGDSSPPSVSNSGNANGFFALMSIPFVVMVGGARTIGAPAVLRLPSMVRTDHDVLDGGEMVVSNGRSGAVTIGVSSPIL